MNNIEKWEILIKIYTKEELHKIIRENNHNNKLIRFDEYVIEKFSYNTAYTIKWYIGDIIYFFMDILLIDDNINIIYDELTKIFDPNSDVGNEYDGDIELDDLFDIGEIHTYIRRIINSPDDE